jgi:hypothetical protein
VSHSDCAIVRLSKSCRRFLPTPVTCVTRLCLHTQLYGTVPPRTAGLFGPKPGCPEHYLNLSALAELKISIRTWPPRDSKVVLFAFRYTFPRVDRMMTMWRSSIDVL